MIKLSHILLPAEKTASSAQFTNMSDLVDALATAKNTGNFKGITQQEMNRKLERARVTGQFAKIASKKSDEEDAAKHRDRMITGGAVGSIAGTLHGFHSGRDPVGSALVAGLIGAGLGHAVHRAEKSIHKSWKHASDKTAARPDLSMLEEAAEKPAEEALGPAEKRLAELLGLRIGKAAKPAVPSVEHALLGAGLHFPK